MKKSALVVVVNNRPITTSLKVADQFGKRHDNVMAAIKAISNDIEDALTFKGMFNETTYADKYGREKPMYEMTRDGFSLLAMGFTGKKALEFKLKFINEFNRMEAALKSIAAQNQIDPRWAETRQLGKKTRKLLTAAIKALEDYFQERGKVFPTGYLYGHLTNLIQNALSIQKGCRDNCSVKKLNQLDQTEDIAGNVILQSIASNNLRSLADIDAQILLQIRKLNNLLSGQLSLPC